jgi:hypothetical protein
MATTYTSTIEINVWKEHTCLHCGSRFRYLFKRKKTGRGRTQQAASEAARKTALQSLEHEVDLHPCPGCGLYQPDMIGSWRAFRHGLAILASLVLVILFLIFLLTDEIMYGTAALAMTAGCGLVGLVHLLLDARNFNRDLERNQQTAQLQVERGDLWVPPGTKAEQQPELPVFGWSFAHTIAYVLFGLGLLALVSPELLRAMHGWPINPAWVPPVIGPGDDPYLYFPNSIDSVKGYWQGNATAEVLNAVEAGLTTPQLRATSQADQWGQTIRIGSRESKTSSKTLWVRITLPPDAQLEGKTLQVHMKLDVTYPALQGNSWVPANGHFEYTTAVHLASAAAGRRYRAWWWGGFVGGVLLLTVSSFMLLRLATGLRKLAEPTSIFSPGQEEEAPEVLPADKSGDENAEGIVRREEDISRRDESADG